MSMRLSHLADYAIVLMSAAARHCGGVRINAGTLSEETGVPLPTAQKLVSLLSRAGLMKSARGTGGGIRLARPAAAISLADIVEAIEGPIAMTSCVDDTRHECALEGNCRVQPHWGAVNSAVRGALGGVSLASLVSTPSPLPARLGSQQVAVEELPFLSAAGARKKRSFDIDPRGDRTYGVLK
jgi:FeS assembly SUF system regulator